MTDEKAADLNRYQVTVYKVDSMATRIIETKSPADARRIALEQRNDLHFQTADTPFLAFCDPTPVVDEPEPKPEDEPAEGEPGMTGA